MHASEMTPEVARHANELYWTSGRSVNQIADDLNLSKGALYSVIEPHRADAECPLCGMAAGYPNRTAKEHNRLKCLRCDWDSSSDDTSSYASDEEDASTSTPLGDPSSTVPPPPVTPTPRVSIMGGALLGAAIGLALVLWARGR